MWICLNNAFFSAVASPTDPDLLVVRARRAGDLERVFPESVGKTIHTPHRDYAYRAHMARDVVAAAVMCQVLGIDYGNFKDSVKEPGLKSAYSRVWSIMAGLQVRAPWSGAPRRSARPQRQQRLRAPGLDDGESPFFPVPGLSSAGEY